VTSLDVVEQRYIVTSVVSVSVFDEVVQGLVERENDLVGNIVLGIQSHG
jgi:hypothetical protein